MLSISVCAMELPLVHPFKIARCEEAIARTAIVRVSGAGLEGIGEATPIDRYGESVESVIAYFERNPLAGDDPFQLESLLRAEIPAAARAGLDLALHDLIGKELGKPLYALLGLDPSRAPLTSFTIGIADPQMTLRKVDEAAHYPILKVKLGSGTLAEQVEIVAAIRARYSGALRIDANEGWSVDEAIIILRELARYEIEFCEQPVAAGNPQALRAVRDRVSIPIVADEDCLVASDLPPSVWLRRRRQRQACQSRRHSRRAGDDSHRSRNGIEGDDRVHGRERDCRDGRGTLCRRWPIGPISTDHS